MGLILALVGLAIMVSVVAFVFTEDDTYIHPWDMDDEITIPLDYVENPKDPN